VSWRTAPRLRAPESATCARKFAWRYLLQGAPGIFLIYFLPPPVWAQHNYTTLEFGAAATLPTGIRGDNVTAAYLVPGNTSFGGLLRDLSSGTETPFPEATASGVNYPNAIRDIPYGSSFGSLGGILEAVGTYTPQSSQTELGFLENAATVTANQLTTLAYPTNGAPVDTAPHSIFGNQVVGIYFTSGTRGGEIGNAFNYDISTGTYKTHNFPGAFSTEAYGVWGSLVAGTYAAKKGGPLAGYIFDEKTRTWTSYNYPGATATIFHGITGGGRHDTYNVVGDFISNGNKNGFALHLSADGHEKWVPLSVPDSILTTGNSIYGNTVVGTYNNIDVNNHDSNDQGYVVTVPDIYHPIQNASALNVAASDGRAIKAISGDDVVNNGIINVTGPNSAGIHGGATGVITNNGSILATGAGSAALLLSGRYGTFLNFGTITAVPGAYTPTTIFGFALGGGATNWGLANGNGTGRSDAFQTGVYAVSYFGPAYVAGALAFANQWFTTNRGVLGDGLTANFVGQSYGGRVEGGYRFAVPMLALPTTIGITPYAAAQAQDFHTPSYSESDLNGGGFGLSYAAMNATDVRTELGSRFDDAIVLGGLPVLLRGRLAWAHDFVSDPSLNAAFESLPAANFTVDGAPIPQNTTLASAGAELFLAPRVSLLLKFDGEFAPGSQTYSGSGALRFNW
jgi:hypothetical protein